MLFVVGAALVSCEQDEAGELVTPTVVAALRYVNAVSDTGAMDFRVIDIVGDAPNTVGATFRTGGNPQGIATTLPPPYLSVLAGARRIRVFMSSTDPAIASIIMLDTTYTFEASRNYTFFLYGFAGTGQSPALKALITLDDAPTPAADQIAVRTINLAPGTTAGAASVDAWVVAQSTGTPTLTGSAAFPSQQFLNISSYSAVATGTYQVAVSGSGTTTPVLFRANMPTGTVGTATANPIAGTTVAGSVLTAVLLPPSVTGSAAPQTAAFLVPTLIYLVDRRPANTAP